MTTFSIVNELNLADKRALVAELKDAIKSDVAAAKAAKANAEAEARKTKKKKVSFINGPPNPVKSTFQCTTNEKGQICCKTTN